MHYVNTDKRLDEWVPKEHCRKVILTPPAETMTGDRSGEGDGDASGIGSRKRKRGRQARNMGLDLKGGSSQVHPTAGSTGGSVLQKDSNHSETAGTKPTEITVTEEDYDIQHHKQITAHRNFDKVHFGEWQVKTW